MIVFFKEKLVFLAVPKTGTTAWQAALGTRADIVVRDPPDLKHAPIYRYNRFFRPMIEKFGGEGFEILAVVREPVSWLGSWYRYRQRPFMTGKPNSTEGIDFDRFVTGYCQDPRPGYANVGSQHKFLEPRPNGVGVDYLFRYEAQDELRTFLENRLDMQITLDRVNVSPEASLDLTDATRRLLHDKNAAEFNLWDAAGTTIN